MLDLSNIFEYLARPSPLTKKKELRPQHQGSLPTRQDGTSVLQRPTVLVPSQSSEKGLTVYYPYPRTTESPNDLSHWWPAGYHIQTSWSSFPFIQINVQLYAFLPSVLPSLLASSFARPRPEFYRHPNRTWRKLLQFRHLHGHAWRQNENKSTLTTT